jgi:hypothetical protein
MGAVFFENAGGRELAEAVADHVFGYEHRVENLAVFDLVSLALTIFSIRWPSTNGPFLIERPMS